MCYNGFIAIDCTATFVVVDDLKFNIFNHVLSHLLFRCEIVATFVNECLPVAICGDCIYAIL